MMAEISFVVLKINGVDVSQLPRGEVVEMFLAADDTLFVEMRRQFITSSFHKNTIDVASSVHSTNIHFGEEFSNAMQDIVNTKLKKLKIASSSDDLINQEDIPSNANLLALEKLFNVEDNALFAKAFMPCDLVLTMKPTSSLSMKNAELKTNKYSQTDNNYFVYQSAKENAERLIEQEHNIFEQCLAPEIDIEEITLRKSDSNERLGLVVCYSSCNHSGNIGNNTDIALSSDENEKCTEVYISGIQPDSVAARDGRLRQGDQILQINGKDVKNREETELLIAENNNAVTLLVSRYIYTDEDDFNDPLVAELDVEEEDDEEYYDERNLGYENGFLTNDCLNVVKDLGKVFMAQTLHSANNVPQTSSASCTNANTVCNTVRNCQTKSSLKEIEQRIAVSDAQKLVTLSKPQKQAMSQKESRSLKEGPVPCPSSSTSCSTTKIKSENTSIHIDYETEHIYETIPEDSESEPFYCSPYESTTYVTAVGSCASTTTDAIQFQQQQKQRVAQWLGIRSSPSIPVHNSEEHTGPKQSSRIGINCGRSVTRFDSTSLAPRNKNGTVRSTTTCVTNVSSSSSGGCSAAIACNLTTDGFQNEDQDNSSSAYNTGGSNNSTTPLIAAHNSHFGANICEEEEETLLAITHPNRAQRTFSSKDKVISPKKIGTILGKSSAVNVSNTQTVKHNNSDGKTSEDVVPAVTAGAVDQPATTMYTNESNLYKAMILQQYMYSQAISNKNQQIYKQLTKNHFLRQQSQLHCPQFTAPNLSQYHFVSSQEVGASTQQVANEETMVWKVKRRPDGSRYIVRRPARNRCLLRERSIRVKYR